MSQPTFNLRIEIHRRAWQQHRKEIEMWLQSIDRQIADLEALTPKKMDTKQTQRLETLIKHGRLLTATCLLVDGLFDAFTDESGKWSDLLLAAYASMSELEFLRTIYQEHAESQELNDKVIVRLGQTILNAKKQ